MKRKIAIQPRKENVRDKRVVRVVNFQLSQILQHFEENMLSIKRHFSLADELFADGRINEAKDIWRTQIVFLESALDYYMHEITKFGMRKIFNNEWGKSEKFNNYNLKLEDVIYAISNPEDTVWFENHVNDSFRNKTFMDFEPLKDQLSLIGVKPELVADEAYYVQGSSDKTIDQLKRHIKRIFCRRNAIAHQSDRNHETGSINDISKSDVIDCIDHIEKIVKAIDKCIQNKDQLNTETVIPDVGAETI